MAESIPQTHYQREYLQHILETGNASGVQTWLAFFKASLDQSRFNDCEQLLAVAKRTPLFHASEAQWVTVIHNEGLLRLFPGRLDKAKYSNIWEIGGWPRQR
jgi:hypothetical protein